MNLYTYAIPCMSNTESIFYQYKCICLTIFPDHLLCKCIDNRIRSLMKPKCIFTKSFEHQRMFKMKLSP